MRDDGRPLKITIHCSASPNLKPYTAAQITKDHIARGWRTIGYHGVIQPDGTYEQGRGFDEQGAHVDGFNKGNIGLCLIGTNLFSVRQFSCLRRKVEDIRGIYQIPYSEIYGHYEFTRQKTCPNIRISKLVSYLILDDRTHIAEYIAKTE